MATATHPEIVDAFTRSNIAPMMRRVQDHPELSHAERFAASTIESILYDATQGNLAHCQSKLEKLQAYTDNLPDNKAGDFPAKAMITQINDMLLSQIDRAIKNGNETISTMASQSHLAAVPASAQTNPSIASNFTAVNGAVKTSANDDNANEFVDTSATTPATAKLYHFNPSNTGLTSSFSPAVMGETPSQAHTAQPGLMARYTSSNRPSALAA